MYDYYYFQRQVADEQGYHLTGAKMSSEDLAEAGIRYGQYCYEQGEKRQKISKLDQIAMEYLKDADHLSQTHVSVDYNKHRISVLTWNRGFKPNPQMLLTETNPQKNGAMQYILELIP